METKEQCMCMCIYVFFLHIDLFFYVFFVYFILSTYVFLKSMHVYLHKNMCCNSGNGQFFLGAKPAQTGGKQTLFSTFFKTELLWIKNVQYQNAQDGKSTIVKTTVYHIICKAALVWKKRISRKIAEYIGIHGCSWGFMCVHGCSLVFICFCLVVWLFVCLIVFKTPPIFWSWKNGIEMEVPEWLFSFGLNR